MQRSGCACLVCLVPSAKAKLVDEVQCALLSSLKPVDSPAGGVEVAPDRPRMPSRDILLDPAIRAQVVQPIPLLSKLSIRRRVARRLILLVQLRSERCEVLGEF